MAKNRITVYLNDKQTKILKELTDEDVEENMSYFMARLLVDEKKRRDAEKQKRGRGRPQKDEEAPDELYEPDYSDDLPKTINHYGKLIGKQEMADIEERTRMHNNMHKD